MNKSKKLIAALAVPVLILVGMCFTPLYTLITGEDIILETVPVDPTDLFRGDYVTLRYAAEEIPKSLVDEEVLNEYQSDFKVTEVFVLLEKKGGVHAPRKVTLEEPEQGLFLKGELQYINKTVEGVEAAFIEYSLDRYYVEDNSGTEWEEASAQGEVLVKAKLKNGYAVLTDIMIKE
ncbi:GDYXXLXY domain-containing protein [Neobacillus niacini]|uniref:GDYXXLXY domain-containing protein n=1 Tax=Neobacillus niacini TaxID=86668 RepID=UPI00204250F0|nr:GDYXXLXY domain-containing protein [Neobacillus niacini]MCM3693509.1 GDYXXLXY domain-containing protein [Neobacillus niacini]